jgi:hypothetical protein
MNFILNEFYESKVIERILHVNKTFGPHRYDMIIGRDLMSQLGIILNFDRHDKICMMMTRLACNQAIESSYWRMDNDSGGGLLMGYVLYRLPVELEFMDLDTFPH